MTHKLIDWRLTHPFVEVTHIKCIHDQLICYFRNVMNRMGLQTDLNASDQSRTVEFDETNEIRVGRERDENKIFIAK